MNDSLLIYTGWALAIVLGFVAAQALGSTALAGDGWAFAGAFSGACLAVFATIAVATHQTRTRVEEAKHARRREQLGARAILASDLSQIMGYAEESAGAAMRGDRINEREVPNEVIACPALGPNILLRLQRLVELLDGEDANQIVDLMHCYQVQEARLNGALTTLNDPERRTPHGLVLNRNDFEFTLPATVELFLRAEALFSFSRREQESIALPPFSEDRVQSALNRLGVRDWLSNVEHDAIVSQMTNLSPHGRWRRN